MGPKPNVVLVWDIDQTLLVNWAVWDFALLFTSLQLFGAPFRLTQNHEGQCDLQEIVRLSSQQIIGRRMTELGIASSLDLRYVYDQFILEAMLWGKVVPSKLLPGVKDFLLEFADTTQVVLSGNGRGAQVLALQPIAQHFVLGHSLFLGEFESKCQALDTIAAALQPELLVHLGDLPSDMQALRSMRLPSDRKLAVAVTVLGFVPAEEMIAAGADMVIEAYTQEAANRLKDLLREKSQHNLGKR